MSGTASQKALDLGLLTLRTAVGATLFAHGAQKLAGWFGGPGVDGTAQGMAAMGFEPAKVSAVAAGAAEAAGGLVALGAGTRVAASVGAAAMVAAAEVHRPSGFFAQQGGFEYPAVLGVAAASLALTGPGRYSVDAVLGRRIDHPALGAAALAASLLGAAAVLSRRSTPAAA